MNHKLQRRDVAEAPIRVLRHKTRQAIALYLDSRKLLLSNMKYHRDFRGLADYANIDSSVIRSSKISSTEHCLHLWSQKGGLLLNLWEALEQMDRFDVIDDTRQLIYDDYDSSKNNEVLGFPPVAPPFEDTHQTIAEFDSNILTTDDQQNLKNGKELQDYAAVVLYADEDLDFVNTMVEMLEGQYNLKLCLKDRDLIGGLSFESSAVVKIIKERCARVIVVLSPAFLKSKANNFLTQFAHALSIEQQRRIVIPCMYKPCKKPLEISYCHSLDYFRYNGLPWNYWKKLFDSIEPLKSSDFSRPTGPFIREVPVTSISSAGTLLAGSINGVLPISNSPENDTPHTTTSVTSMATSIGFNKKKETSKHSSSIQIDSNSSVLSLPNAITDEPCWTTDSPRSSSSRSLSTPVSNNGLRSRLNKCKKFFKKKVKKPSKAS